MKIKSELTEQDVSVPESFTLEKTNIGERGPYLLSIGLCCPLVNKDGSSEKQITVASQNTQEVVMCASDDKNTGGPQAATVILSLASAFCRKLKNLNRPLRL